MIRSQSVFDTPVTYLQGVGPQRADLLSKELKIFTFNDLLHFFPFRYVDRTKFYKVNEINSEMSYVQLYGKITHSAIVGKKFNQRLIVDFEDSSGNLELIWFQGIKWITKKLLPGKDYIVFGKVSIYNGRFSIAHPSLEEFTPENIKSLKGLKPMYSSTEILKQKGLDSGGISKLQRALLDKIETSIGETLPQYIIEQLRLLPRRESLKNIHFPSDNEFLEKARSRLIFEELFYLQLRLLKNKAGRDLTVKGHPFEKVGKYVNDFYTKYLPFPLTVAQKKVIREIRKDLGSGKQMNRLLQGDVGSGKTLVALLSMLIALDNGYQCCLMAPTEILAMQHDETIREFLKDMPVQISILTGSSKRSERDAINENLTNGKLQIITGTHALIEENIRFNNLGLVIIDEQHRFGVNQRAQLWLKNEIPPHILVMTATPIPRTLAMTLYGDLDVSIIDMLPPGRLPVQTFHQYSEKRENIYSFIRKELEQGRQCYIIYPFIEESENSDIEFLLKGFKEISNSFSDYKVGMVHGKMKNAEREKNMSAFNNNEIKILVATTVIEVGVNVPNASIIVVESAQKFGLSQLHQLRGRVGRSNYKSYCILITPHQLGEDARNRIGIMVRTNDGFIIAEEDMQQRGPGDISGTQQSGILNLKIADLVKDSPILNHARIIASEILADDILLSKDKNGLLKEKLELLIKEKGDWSRIS